MTEDQFSTQHQQAYQRPDNARRWYAWQISLRNQPSLIRHILLVQPMISSVPGLHPVPPHWLRLPLGTVGSTDDIPFSTATEIAESVDPQLQQIAPADITLGGFAVIGNELVLKVHDHEVLDEIQDRIKKDTYQAVTDYHVPIAVGETAGALDAIAGSDLATATVRIHISGISHVLFNPESFTTGIWTNLNVLGLRDSTYPG